MDVVEGHGWLTPISDTAGRGERFVPVRVWNYGLAGFDRTNVVKVNCWYDVPGVKWNNRAIGTVLNDWHVTGIASFVRRADGVSTRRPMARISAGPRRKARAW